ncbi:DUF975 family protein [Microbacteriaceae bacterium 4G12]
MISDLKKRALSSLKGKWGLGAGASFLYWIVPTVSIYIMIIPLFLLSGLLIAMNHDAFVSYSFSGEEEITLIGVLGVFLIYAFIFIFSIAIQGIMNYGYKNITLRLAKQESTGIDGLFEGFRKNNIFKSIKLALLTTIYTFLWSLLLVVPGIIKFISYSMAYFIILDHPEYTASEAIKKSQEMMKGHKLDLFMLTLSFIGWFILGLFTFSIGYLWIYPYYMTTVSQFYLNLVNRDEVIEEQVIEEQVTEEQVTEEQVTEEQATEEQATEEQVTEER